jgi:hypothetical protein
MSWLRISDKALYLMEGGTDKYIDKVAFSSTEPAKIKDFPNYWFTQADTRPTTIIAENGNILLPKSFSDLNFLKLLELPINNKFYKQLKECRSLDSVIKKFYELIGGFSNEFFLYEYNYKTLDNKKVIQNVKKTFFLLPPKISNRSNVKFYADRDLRQFFPDLDFQETKPPYFREEPSFASDIFLSLIFNCELTIIPRLIKFSLDDKNIRVELTFQDLRIKDSVTQAVDIQTLDKALLPITLTEIELSLESDILDVLNTQWGINVIPSGSFGKDDFIGYKTLGKNFTFIDYMDAIAIKTLSDWDWEGKFAFIKKRRIET